MDLLHAFILAIVQGLTEFLPVSSSGHLILAPHLFGWEDQGLAFDAAIHMGTLAAIVLYFRRQLTAMAVAWWRSITRGERSPDAWLAWAVLWGTIPVGLAGLLCHEYIETHLRSPLLVAGTLAGYGVLLWLADALGRRERDEYSVGWRDVIVIGCAQALALVPGTSRSGITITAALAMGLTREAAARYSFLLAVPGVALAGLYESFKMVESGAASTLQWQPVVVGIVMAAVSGVLCIHFLLKFIQRFGLLTFAIYRLLLAGVILYVFI